MKMDSLLIRLLLCVEFKYHIIKEKRPKSQKIIQVFWPLAHENLTKIDLKFTLPFKNHQDWWKKQ